MANNVFQVKRTSTSGRTPNTTSSGNSQYINAGELALNMTDQVLYTSDGTNLITVGSNVANQRVGNLTISAITANGSLGSSGQALTTNGSNVYWSTIVGTNTAAAYVWSNTHTFNANVTLATTASLIANGTQGITGQVLTSNGSSTYWGAGGSGGGATSVLVRQTYVANGSVNTFTVTSGYTANNLDVYLNGVKLQSTTGVNTTSGSTFTILGGTPANGTLIEVVGGLQYTNVLLLTANNSNALGGINAAGYALLSGASFTGPLSFGNAVSLGTTGNGTAGQVMTSNGSGAPYWVSPVTFVNTSATWTWSNTHTFNGNVIIGTAAGISANGTYGTAGQVLTSNGITAYWSPALTISGAANVGSLNVTGNASISGNMTVTGNLTVTGTTVSIGANNLIVQDSVLSLHTYANLAPWTLNDGKAVGIAFHYYDTADKQGLLSVTQSNGVLTYYSTSTDAAIADPVGNNLGTIQGNAFYAGNSTVYTIVNNSNFTGTANNSLYLGGVAAASYVNTSGAYTISGVHTHSANVSITGTTKLTGVVDAASSNTLNQTLTDGATISWDVSLGQIATVTLAGNRTIAAPTNLKVSTYILHVIQDATGSRTLTWNSVFKWTAGVAPTLTTTANRRDVFTFVSDGTYLYGSFLPDVR